jgi:hypothetical protein
VADCGEIEKRIMNEQRLHIWTRALAQAGSRRSLLRGLMGGAAVLEMSRRDAPSAAAHHGGSGPGDPCRSDNQCLGADAFLVCAWNGTGHDGSTNCCTYEGGRCGFDEACCGYAICVGGYCADVSVAPTPGCTSAGCACVPGWYGYDPCDDGLVCCQAETGQLMCLPLYTCTS